MAQFTAAFYTQHDPVAHASHPVFFEIDPAGQHPDLPFDLQAIEDDGPHPMWELRHTPPDQCTLYYHAWNPIYRELPDQPKNSNKTAGRRSFITQICASGLLDWALYPLQTQDTSNIDLLKRNATNGDGNPLRDQYLERLERLEVDYQGKRTEQPSEYDLLKRQTVADMLHIFQGAQ